MCLILTHKQPHLDELTSAYIVKQIEGEKEVTLAFTSCKNEINNLLKKNPNGVFLGVGGSELDEHSRNGVSVDAKSSVELFSSEFHIPFGEYEGLMKYAHNNDSQGSKILMELANIIKTKYERYSETEVFAWFENLIDHRTAVVRSLGEKETKNQAQIRKEPHIDSRSYQKKFRSGKSIQLNANYQTMLLPKSFNVNQLVAVKIGQNFGNNLGINYRTKIKFVDPKHYVPRRGELAIGFGDGVLSEFPAEYMAQLCCISDKNFRKYKLVMDYIKNLNTRTGYHPFEFAHLLMIRQFDVHGRLHDYKGLWKAFHWGSEEINLFVEKHCLFLHARRHLKNIKKEHKLSVVKVNGLKLCALHSNDYDDVITNVLRSPDGENADIVICKKKSGNIVILFKAHPARKLNTAGLVAQIRRAECKVQSRHVSKEQERLFYCDGSLDCVPEWYYQSETGNILNGSKTHQETPPTQIPLEKIQAFVVKTMKMSR